MKRSLASSLGIALSSSLLALASTGCAGDGEVRDDEADGLDSVATHGDQLTRSYWRSRHRVVSRPDGGTDPGTTAGTGGGTGTGGSTGGSAGTGDGTGDGDAATECAVCEQASACCTDVDAGSLCTFSAVTCASLAPSARDAYVVSCKTLLNTVASVRTAMPASCQ
jgi:hypothetical protein